MYWLLVFFVVGEKHIAIITEAASSGISLHAGTVNPMIAGTKRFLISLVLIPSSDKRAKNQRQRVMITMELPWSADQVRPSREGSREVVTI